MKTTVTITSKATIDAEGKLNNRKTKAVICIDTGEVYSSCTDAAKANGVTQGNMSACCVGRQSTANGKKYCYVDDLPKHLEALTNSLQAKTKMLERNALYIAEREAEERRAMEIEKLEQKYARKLNIYEQAKRKCDTAHKQLIVVKNELDALRA